MTRAAALAVLLAAAGCRSAAPPPAAAMPSAPGVIAGKQGDHGLVQVVERDGLRMLLIDGAVQGAMRADAPAPADPLPEIVASAKPEAKRVLLIGLGTGRTAATFLSRGFLVEPVELDPVVLDFARKHFGYTGPCEIADGLEVLRRPGARWDAIVIDAFTGGETPGPLFEPTALRSAASRAPLVIARLHGQPLERFLRETILSEMGAHHAMLGDGTLLEPQNLVLIGSRTPFAVRVPPTSALRPLVLPSQGRPTLAPATELEQATLTGYLVRLSENGAIALDLPHWEMGAVRYLLTGATVAELSALLPGDAKFPTTGEIGSDGDTSHTLKGLLGGGDVMRADTRLSPVAATLTGTVRFRTAVDADLVFGGRLLKDRAKPGPEPLLPYGGALYELEVTKIEWSFAQSDWARIERDAAPRRAAALAALRKGDAVNGHIELAKYVDALERGVGGPRMGLLRGIREPRRIRDLLARVPTGAPPYDHAVACEQTLFFSLADWWREDLEPMKEALVACARAGYERSLSAKTPAARLAAGRLKALLADAETARDRKLAERLARDFPDVEPREAPPSPETLPMPEGVYPFESAP